MTSSDPTPRIAVIGAGPAGLMAAEVLAQGGAQVDVFDAMPSVGRKFLLAGIGGLNLTHSEPTEPFLARYGARRTQVAPWLADFNPQDLRDWAQGLGVETFVGSSGRVFPVDMKAAPLLRAWLARLRAAGVRFHMRHRWLGWSAQALRFDSPTGEVEASPAAVVLALGGASWPQLGSDGAWVPHLCERGVPVAELQASNCGFDVAGWSEHLRSRFAGEPLKAVAITVAGEGGQDSAPRFSQRSECVLTATGLEGSLVYAASPWLRDDITAQGHATLWLDLLPTRELAWVLAELKHPRGPRSLATHLKTRLGLHGVKTALLHELLSKDEVNDPERLAGFIKALPIQVQRTRPITEAISSAGGVAFDGLDDHLMLRAAPGVFCAGEMLDWEAPTGGYLLSACFASGRRAGEGALGFVGRG